MRAILKQTSYLFLAQTLTRVISFFYIIYLAKVLGVSDFGLLTVALAYFSIISSAADFGFNRFLIREVAKDRSKATDLVWNVLMLRLTLTSLLFAAFSVILYFIDPDKMRVSLSLLAALAILPQGVALTFDGIFVGLRKLQFSAISLFLSSLSTALAGWYLVGKGLGPMGAVNALIFGQLIYVLVLVLFLYKNQALVYSSISLTIIKKAIIGSLPYGLLGILGLLYFRIDTVILSYLKGSFEAGIYGVAYRFLEAVTFIPSAYFLALFPVLARIHNSPANIKKLYFKSFKIMLGIGLLVMSGYLLILPQLIKMFLPQFSQTILAIGILSLSIPFMFIHVPAVSVLLSTDKYLRQVLFLSILILMFNIVANLAFIPQFGFVAASWITVFSEMLSFTIFFLFTKYKILDKAI